MQRENLSEKLPGVGPDREASVVGQAGGGEDGAGQDERGAGLPEGSAGGW